ncbi:MAG: hypothetical protein R3284_04730, partial [Rubricoccaceae bacterium]|nr:hypothetical protein [Rubricoccaceae bacterium]
MHLRIRALQGVFTVAFAFYVVGGTVVSQSFAQTERSAASSTHPQSIASVLRDANGDLVPDAVGDTITISGRATVSSGQLHQNWTEVFIQDGTGGIKLVASSAAPPIVAGDSLLVRGLLEHEAGMAQLTDPAFRKIDAPAAEPLPQIVQELSDKGLEAYEGQLVEVKGTVAARVPNEGGDNLVLLVGEQLLIVFAYANRPTPISFEEYKVGQYVRVRGVAGQFDRRAPYNASYQIFPRTARDIERAGFSPQWYRSMAMIIGLLLLAALVWAWLLRRQVRKRVNQLQVSQIRYGQLFNAAGDCVLVYENTRNG